jgi:hypothetical protein
MALYGNYKVGCLSMEDSIKCVNEITGSLYSTQGKTFGGFLRDYHVPLSNGYRKVFVPTPEEEEHRLNVSNSTHAMIPKTGEEEKSDVSDLKEINVIGDQGLKYWEKSGYTTGDTVNLADFKDIDTWFTTIEQKDEFIKVLHSKNFILLPEEKEYRTVDKNGMKVQVIRKKDGCIDEKKNSSGDVTTKEYPFMVFRYVIVKYLPIGKTGNFREFRTYIDICVSKVFPVNDFSINLLSFDGKNLKVEEYYEIFYPDDMVNNYGITKDMNYLWSFFTSGKSKEIYNLMVSCLI